MNKILSFSYAGMLSQQLRAEGKHIIFTSGCFDILHIGHTEFFRLIKKKYPNSVLFVGIDTDGYLLNSRKRKPYFSQKIRAQVVSQLNSIDYVVILKEKDLNYQLFIKRFYKIHPNLLVYGNTEKLVIDRIKWQANSINLPLKIIKHRKKLASSSKIASSLLTTF